MIPPAFFVMATLPWLFAGRCAAVYWQTIADILSTDDRAESGVVALPPPGPRRTLPPDHVAKLIRLTPKSR